ncbi:ABC transporter permease [Dyella kyungheensis]|uniref:ABC transporter permease n=1 Tax=Dyella kyungheensis TaxID=1242174 RepID=UPI003CF743BB
MIVALKRHKAGTILIALQIALTLAIVCNALHIVHLRVDHLSRPTGINEAQILRVESQWANKPAADQLRALTASDLAVLRQIPGVVDVYASNAYPLGNNGWPMGLSYAPDQRSPTTSAAMYFSDEHTVNTLDLKLLAGRNFRADEIGEMDVHGHLTPAVVIITKDLADRMFPKGSALGQVIYMSSKPSTVIGVVPRLQVPWLDSFATQWDQRSVLVPYRLDQSQYYIVRTAPGRSAAVTAAIPERLYAANPDRVIDPAHGIQSFEQIKADAYRKDHGMAVVMMVICIALLSITSAGIVGLTSFWVAQRRRQIGVRRALGATRRDILSYFLIENGVISGAGVVAGILLALGLNIWLVSDFEMQRLSPLYLVAGALMLLCLGQLSALVPAWRASRLSPSEATRV